jgi:hypothetical protein
MPTADQFAANSESYLPQEEKAMTDKSEGEALLDRIGLRFQSGNSVPVERATITRAEYEALRASPQPSEPAAPVEVLGDVYGAVWSALIEAGADVGSARKAAEKAAELARTANPEPAAAEPVASRCPDCRGSGWLQEGVNAMVTRQIECHRCKGKGLIYAAPPSASAPSQPSEGVQPAIAQVTSTDTPKHFSIITPGLPKGTLLYAGPSEWPAIKDKDKQPRHDPSCNHLQGAGCDCGLAHQISSQGGVSCLCCGHLGVAKCYPIDHPHIFVCEKCWNSAHAPSEGPARVTDEMVEAAYAAWDSCPHISKLVGMRAALEAAALAAAEGKGNG